MIITTARHERIVAAKDAEIERLLALQNEWFFAWQKANAACCYRDDTIADLTARLGVFTAPRQRGERGRFLSTKGEAA